MSSILSPYPSSHPLLSPLFRDPPYAIPIIDDLQALQAELRFLQQMAHERAKKAGNDLKAIEESMRRMKEKEERKARAVEKVRNGIGRAYVPGVNGDDIRPSVSSVPSVKASYGVSHTTNGIHSSRSSLDPRPSISDDLKKKEKKRKREDGSDVELEPQGMRRVEREPGPQDDNPQIIESEPQKLVDRHEPQIPAWKHLISHPFATDERISLITDIFSNSNEVDMVNHLHGGDAQTFVDVIDEILNALPPWLQKKCLGTLRKICGRSGLLPRSIKIQFCYDRSDTPLYQGGYADVWMGQYQGCQVAVKVLRVYANSDFEKITRRFCKEVVTWKTLCHPNVLPLLGVIMGNRHFAMVAEWMVRGNIKEFTKANRDVNRFELLKDITNGLIYMHGRSMIHGDLKGANILVDKNGHACIADFGLLTIVSDPAYATASSSVLNAGTVRWMSPELLHPENFNLKASRPTRASDCYALGMVVLEVLSDRVPYSQFKDFIVIRTVIEGTHPERPERPWFTDDLWRTLEQCWLPQPGNRPTAEVILECLGRVAATWQPLPSGVDEDKEEGIVSDESVSMTSL